MKTKIVYSVCALIMFLTLTVFATSCGEPAAPNVTNVIVTVKDNSFSIEDSQINLMFEENKTLNLSKENFNVVVFCSDGSQIDNYTDYSLETNVPSPIAAGQFYVKIKNGDSELKTINVNISKKEIAGFTALQEANISTYYTGEQISGIDLINSQFNNIIANNNNFVEIAENSQVQAANVNDYNITFNAKSNYVFENNTTSVSCSWSITKRVIQLNLATNNINFMVQELEDPNNMGNYYLEAIPVGPSYTFIFEDDATGNNDAFIKTLVTPNGEATATTLGSHTFTISLNGAYNDSYCFKAGDYTSLTNDNNLEVTYNIIPCVIPKATLVEGSNPHYDYDGFDIEPEYETVGTYSFLTKYLYESVINNGTSAINARPTPYEMILRVKGYDEYITKECFIFEDDVNGDTYTYIHDLSYNFYIDKIDYENDSIDDIDGEIVLNINYSENLTLGVVNAKKGSPEYAYDSIGYLTSHNMLDDYAYIDINYYINESGKRMDSDTPLARNDSGYDIWLIYIHNYWGNKSSDYDETYANYNYILIPAKLVVGVTRVDVMASWTVSNTATSTNVDSSSINYNPNYTYAITPTVEDILSAYTDQIQTLSPTYYYCATEVGSYTQVATISNAGWYYAVAEITCSNNYALFINSAPASTVTSPKFHITKLDITLEAVYSGSAVSGNYQGQYFSYYTGSDKTINHTIRITGLAASDIEITENNLSGQNAIEGLNSVYDYCAIGSEIDYEEATDMSAVGYYRLTISAQVNSINYNINTAEFVVIWQIVPNVIDVSAVAWNTDDNYEKIASGDYSSVLLENVPLGAIPVIHYATKVNGILQDDTNIDNPSNLTCGLNYAYVYEFIALEGADGYESVTFTVDDDFVGSSLSYDENAIPQYEATKGKLFTIDQVVISIDDFVWLKNYSLSDTYIGSVNLNYADMASIGVDFMVQHSDSTSFPNDYFTITYTMQVGSDPEEPVVGVPDVPQAVGTYTIVATITIIANDYVFEDTTTQATLGLIVTVI